MSEALPLSHARIRPGRILAWTLLFIGGLIMVCLLYTSPSPRDS